MHAFINDVAVVGAPLPVDVDPSQRELYLENESFKQLFGMDKVRRAGNAVFRSSW